MKSITVRLIVIFISGYMIFNLASLWKDFHTQNKEYEKLVEEYNGEKREIDKYKELLADGNQAKIIEKAARERLGYVYSNEEIYIDISGN